jgi:hypothetical protein
MMEPFHRRMAEIWLKGKDHKFKNLSQKENKEFWESLEAHTRWAEELSRLEALANLAHKLRQKEWEDEICRQIDSHLMNTVGGN